MPFKGKLNKPYLSGILKVGFLVLNKLRLTDNDKKELAPDDSSKIGTCSLNELLKERFPLHQMQQDVPGEG